MRDVVQELLRALNAGRAAAYCRLVETRGSTPQKAGAMMLVFADGSQAGTLGGGCVEADVKRRALAVLESGQSEVARFLLDSDYGWDDGLICGGRMQVLVEPIMGTDAGEYFQRLGDLIDRGEGVTEAIVFGPDAGSPDAGGPDAPANYLFDATGRLVASLHAAESPAAESPSKQIAQIRGRLPDLLHRPRASVIQGVAYLPVLPRCRLVIVGGGHVGKSVAAMAADLDFEVWVVDDREDIISEARFPRAERRIAGRIEDVLPALEITPNTYCLIVTRGHNHDEQALYFLAQRGARYVGLIGSRRKIKMIYEDLLEQGVSSEALNQVYAPLGIDIGSQTVAEITVSVCAELVSHRNRDGQVPGRPECVRVEAAP